MADDEEWMARAADEMIIKRLELEAKGYPEPAILHSLSRAWNTAGKTVEALPQNLKEPAFPHFLHSSLTHTERWLDGIIAAVDNQGDLTEEGGDQE